MPKTYNNKKYQILRMSQLAILTAIIFIMSFTPLGFLNIGPVSITFIMIPVAIGAIIVGPTGGLFLGFMFGLASFIKALTGDPFGMLLLNLNPAFCAITCILPRLLMGWLVGLVFKALRKIDKTKTASFLVASLCGALFNTILFVGFFLAFYGHNPSIYETYASETVWDLLALLITFNAAIEAGVSLVVGGAISKALDHYLPKMDTTR